MIYLDIIQLIRHKKGRDKFNMVKNKSNESEEVKEIYPLIELVEEIYNVDKKVSKNYDASYRELLRIDKVLRGSSDYSGTQGILEENKEKYVSIVKEVVNDRELKKVIFKIGSNKELTGQESERYTEFMVKNAIDERLKEKLNDVELIKQKIDRINRKVNNVLNIIPNYFEAEATDFMKIVLDEYEKEIDELHKMIEKRCEELEDIDITRRTEKIMKAVMGYGTNNIKK